MQQRDYILRMIERIGVLLLRLRQMILGGRRETKATGVVGRPPLVATIARRLRFRLVSDAEPAPLGQRETARSSC